jgi:dephospho-CoA kinase
MSVFTVGLTGGIASGKTLAADAFHALQVPLLEGDAVAREVVQPGTPALEQIKKTFGAGLIQPDGQLDRARLRQRVFAQPAELRKLEAITHPPIRERLRAWRDAQTADYCVLSVPILIESGMDTMVDRILVVDVPAETQLQRLRERDGIPDALARQMLAAQAPREQRLRRADDVIENCGSMDDVRNAVQRLHRFYLELARSGKRQAPGLHLP